MAKKDSVSAAPVAEAEKGTKTTTPQLSELQQSTYTADEFAAMHVRFGTTADMVKTALVLAGKTRCTYAEAEKIIKKFL